MPKAKKAAVTNNRPVKYPEVAIKKFLGEEALTAAVAKDMLGWEEVQDSNYLLIDHEGHKIRCANNINNRPFDRGTVDAICQSILNRRWKFNLENIIIGKTGITISAQHRLVGLVLASQLWTSEKQKHHWHELWKTEPTIETLVAFGCEEDFDTVQTIDNVRTRTASDVLYCCHDIFPKEGPKDRKRMCRSLAFALRLLEDRTHTADEYSTKRTPTLVADAALRHKKLMQCVKHITEEDQPKEVAEGAKPIKGIGDRYLAAPYAAGMMYLMASSSSDCDKYRNAEPPSEKQLNFARLEKSEEFWVLLSSGAAALSEVQHAIASLSNPETGEGGATLAERLAIICKAWNLFIQPGFDSIKKGDLTLKYEMNDFGVNRLVECPNVGGIDLGEKEQEVDEEEDEPTPAEVEPTNEEKAEIEARLKQAQEAKKNGTLGKPKNDKDGKPPAPKILKKPINKKGDKPTPKPKLHVPTADVS